VDLDQAVIVLTVQQLQTWHRDGRSPLDRLRLSASLLLFDEGHYEPAPAWSAAVRQFSCPRVVFTATPFRNDFRLFNADPEHSFFYSFGEAVTDNVIRDIEFDTLREERTPRRFLDRLFGLYHKKIGAFSKTDSRIIIRCDSLESIYDLKAAVEDRGVSCIAVHERIEAGASDTEFRRVPNVQTTDARVWIHQYKLLEGVDDPRFQVIGIYDGFGSVRSVVQQVGRVTRNVARKPNQRAYVLDASGRELGRMWENYREYDRLVHEHGLEALGGERRLVKTLRKVLPGLIYFDGRFRGAADIESLDIETDLQLPCSAVIHHRENRPFSAEAAAQVVFAELEETGRIVAQPILRGDGDGFVLFSVRVANSRLLTDKYFLEPRLAVTVVHRIRSFVCMFDSLGYRPSVIPGAGRRVDPMRLRRLLAEHQGGVIHSVDLVNSSVSGQSLRSKSLSARSISDLPGAFDDHAFVARHAYGRASENGRPNGAAVIRHLGFARGRVRDGGAKYASYPDYLEWLDDVCQILGARDRPVSSALDRFATPLSSAPDPTPRSVLLDLAQVQDLYVTNPVEQSDENDASSEEIHEAEQEPIEIRDLASAVTDDGMFEVMANGHRCTVTVEWDGASAYVLRSRDLERRYRPVDSETPDLLAWLNHEQSFRVIPATPGIVYAHGSFYSPRIRFGPGAENSQLPLLRCARAFCCFDQVTSEKGASGTLPRQAGWEPKSVFGLIDFAARDQTHADLPDLDVGFKGFFANTTLLVCDDMGTEIADFVMLQDEPQGRRRVIFIHAKAHKPADRSVVSASSLNELCGQAIKNLGEIAQYQGSATNRGRKWDEPWQLKRDQPRWRVNHRVRVHPRSWSRRNGSLGEQAWSMLREYVEDPLCEREVWLFTGNILSYAALKHRISETDSPELETVQTVYCVYSAISASAAANARLFLFCGI
jgi:hypothetical protein